MGTYINRGNNAFRNIVSHEYIDKNARNTKWTCVKWNAGMTVIA